jgi:glycosyltransferase involved in cell wall biosynthesis
MDQKPLVSILFLSMNHEKLIVNSLQSVIQQTYSHIEILYADNNSSDQSFEAATSILQNAGIPYKAFKRKQNYGISQNLNFLLNQASGKYIAPLSADDWWELNNLEEKTRYLQKHPHYGMVHGPGYLYYYETGKKEFEKPLSTKSGWLLKDVIKRNFINSIGVLIRKEVFDNVGMFDADSPLEDWEMWIRVAEKYEIGYFNKPLVYYGKIPGKNISDNTEFMNRGYAYIYEKYGHYKEVNEAKNYYRMNELYGNAADNPSFNQLTILVRNWQFTIRHFKEVFKCMRGMVGLK